MIKKTILMWMTTPTDVKIWDVSGVLEAPLARIIRVCYEVTKEVALTETVALGPAMRNLQVGEVLEAELSVVVQFRT